MGKSIIAYLIKGLKSSPVNRGRKIIFSYWILKCEFSSITFEFINLMRLPGQQFEH